MNNVLVVGSGASGVHFALTMLKKGYQITMLDVGWSKPDPVNIPDTYNELKANLQDPAAYFLGKKYEAVVYSGEKDEYYTKFYGFPPSKTHVFSQPRSFKYETDGMVPLFSFAAGGLAEAWTGGGYPLNDDELQEYPFKYDEIGPAYDEVARRIGIIGDADDLVKFFPFHANLLPPLKLDVNSELLVAEYNKRKHSINQEHGCYLGRSRVTTLSRDQGKRKACSYRGRCLWGCPTESLYTPSITLRECLTYANFHYVPGVFVTHFTYNAEGRITSAVAESVNDGSSREFTADHFVLAAGTLSSSKIYMETIRRATGETFKLSGLMDNRQILVPFINLNMIGKKYKLNSYQYHQLAIGLEGDSADEYIHGQITTLKSALVHPIIQNLPMDFQSSIGVFRNLRAALGVVNINLHDRRRQENHLTLKAESETGSSSLSIHYTPPAHEEALIRKTLKRVSAFMWQIKSAVIPFMVHVRPMGASVHYSGTLPMTTSTHPHTVTKECRSRNFKNLYIVDGSVIPFLPAKNITFTLMANAVRVAESAF